MKPILVTILILAVVAGGMVLLRNGLAKRPETPGRPAAVVNPPTPTAADWTPEKIAKDPQGYLQWADQQAQLQIAERQDRLTTLAQQRADIEHRRQQLESNLSDVQNIHDRMARAYRLADDEDRWPLKMAGRDFTRQQAQAVIDRTQKYLDERAALAKNYDDAVDRVDQLTAQVKKSIDDLSTLRDHLALDLEQVRLNNGMAELDKLHDTQAEVESMAKSLAGLDRNPAAVPLPTTQGDRERVDIDSMLK